MAPLPPCEPNTGNTGPPGDHDSGRGPSLNRPSRIARQARCNSATVTPDADATPTAGFLAGSRAGPTPPPSRRSRTGLPLADAASEPIMWSSMAMPSRTQQTGRVLVLLTTAQPTSANAQASHRTLSLSAMTPRRACRRTVLAPIPNNRPDSRETTSDINPIVRNPRS